MEYTTRGRPGHPVKYLNHRSSVDNGAFYRTVADWKFDKAKTLYRKNLLAHFGCVNAIEFSKSGSLLASGGDDRRVLLWNVDKAVVSKNEPEVMQAEHLSNVFSLDFSCSSKKIISAGNDDQVIVHDIQTGAPLDYYVHEQPVYGVSADPVNESIFCSACDDGRILIFDMRDSGNDPFCLANLTSAFHSVMFHPVEPRLVVTANSKEGVASWDVRMPKRVLVKYGVHNSNQCCMSARFNKIGSQILALRRRLPPILYATDSPVHLYQFNHRGYYNSCTMKSCSFAGQHDQYVLSGSDNFDLHLWKIPVPGSDQWVNKAHMALQGHRSIVNQVRYNYVHNVIASSGVEKIVKLWSPFPMPDEPGGKLPSVVTNESERRIYTPDDYVSLVMQAGQGQFMSLTYEAGRKTTREDSRMLAFFDALVQRDINGLSDDESDTFPETSYTNTIYTSPETSSSENEDDDSNPPNFRSLLAADSSISIYGRTSNSITVGETNGETETRSSQQSANGENAVNHFAVAGENPDTNPTNLLQISTEQLGDADATTSVVDRNELNEQTEDRDMTANMITQLILEKENSRRKLIDRTNENENKKLAAHHNGNSRDTDDDTVSGDNHLNEGNCANRSSSSSRPLSTTMSSRTKKSVRCKSSGHKSNYSKHRREFRKKLLNTRRKELMSIPVYESSRNGTTSAASNNTFERIGELLTRNTVDPSDSSLNSSSASTSESSSSEECETVRSQARTKKVSSSKRTSTVISSDSSSADSDNHGSGKDDEASNKPSTSFSAVRDLKRKRRPVCKLNEACKALFKRFSYSEPEVQPERDESGIVPRKRLHFEYEKTSTIEGAEARDVEHVEFKRSTKNKDRNYRKASTGVCSTPSDSGIDVSKEPEPCCSKTCTENLTPVENGTAENKNHSQISLDSLDDAGFGQVESDENSD